MTGRTGRRAFTLIEVLVTLALTMIMMYLFATIFQIAGNFVTRQKGIGENDQSARILTTVLKTDLEARTMRLLAPFHPNMQSLGDDATNRRGYFYYSENNPADDTDDVLQFTIDTSTLPTSNPVQNTRLPGLGTMLPVAWQPGTAYQAGMLARPRSTATATGFVYKATAAGTSGGGDPAWNTTVGGSTPDGGVTWKTLLSPLDQPDGDDGVIAYDTNGNATINPSGASPNNTGSSQYAEVSYFLRHGSLYRRVQLIRQPYNTMNNSSSSQPMDTDSPAAPLIPALYPPYPANSGSGNFWTDFDYAARIMPLDPTGGATGVSFLAQSTPESSLDNSAGSTATFPIGRPDNRFGFDQIYNTTGAGPLTNGAPREYALPYNGQTNTITSATPVFFGRYTDEETSNPGFLFPGAMPQVGGTAMSPMGSGSVLGLDASAYTMWLLKGNPPTASLPLAGGSRRGEDILLTNVVSFDVKLWDNNYSESAGNDVNRNGVIDSGAAFADVGHTAATGDFQQAKNIFPVYGPNAASSSTFTYTAGGSPQWATIGTGSFTYTNNGVTYNFNNVFDTWYRQFNFDNLQRTYDAADASQVYAPAPYRPRLGTAWVAGKLYNVNDLVYSASDSANGYVYQCTANTLDHLSGATEPFSLTDQVGNTITDNHVTWTVQAPAAVQAIQITVKYLDPSQNLLRQVTIVQSLTQ